MTQPKNNLQSYYEMISGESDTQFRINAVRLPYREYDSLFYSSIICISIKSKDTVSVKLSG